MFLTFTSRLHLDFNLTSTPSQTWAWQNSSPSLFIYTLFGFVCVSYICSQIAIKELKNIQCPPSPAQMHKTYELLQIFGIFLGFNRGFYALLSTFLTWDLFWKSLPPSLKYEKWYLIFFDLFPAQFPPPVGKILQVFLKGHTCMSYLVMRVWTISFTINWVP